MNQNQLRSDLYPEMDYRLQLDTHVETGFLYNICLEVNDDSRTPTVDIKKINYSKIRHFDLKLYKNCFDNATFKKILKTYITTDFDQSVTINPMFRNFKTLHVVNYDFENLYDSEVYKNFKTFLKKHIKKTLIDNLVLEIHDQYFHSNFPRSEEEYQKLFESENKSLPKFGAIQFIVRDDTRDFPETERIVKTFLNNDKLELQGNRITPVRGF